MELNLEENRDTELAVNESRKIIPLEKIAKALESFRGSHKIVHCHGVFDLIHIGHIKHLQQAKNLADILVVTITDDAFVNKGPGRPHFNSSLRAQALAALSCVDFVVINHNPTSVEVISQIKPDFYVKGIEYKDSNNDVTGKITDEENAVVANGGELIFTDDIVFSSSALLNKYFSPFTEDVLSYLNKIKLHFDGEKIKNFFHEISKLKVLVIGEAIIDIYHFGEAIGKAGKEPVLVTKYHREEMYAGGILAVANHLSSFCKEVHCITMLGEKGQYKDFIDQKLNKNIKVTYHYKKDSPTPVKRRYVEEYSSQKLFEIYEIEDCFFEGQEQKKLLNSINDIIEDYDLVIVTDYGHGLLDHECIELIQQKAKFLAVNTQANAGNHGFNCISKYKKADYVCIANRELQLNFRQKHITLKEQLKRLMHDFDYKNVVITNGIKGSYISNNGENIVESPSLTTSVKDRVGAGDAVLAITSLFVACGASPELVGFIGNAVGAQAVNIMGNKSFIEKTALVKHIIHLLK